MQIGVNVSDTFSGSDNVTTAKPSTFFQFAGLIVVPFVPENGNIIFSVTELVPVNIFIGSSFFKSTLQFQVAIVVEVSITPSQNLCLPTLKGKVTVSTGVLNDHLIVFTQLRQPMVTALGNHQNYIESANHPHNQGWRMLALIISRRNKIEASFWLL